MRNGLRMQMRNGQLIHIPRGSPLACVGLRPAMGLLLQTAITALALPSHIAEGAQRAHMRHEYAGEAPQGRQSARWVICVPQSAVEMRLRAGGSRPRACNSGWVSEPDQIRRPFKTAVRTPAFFCCSRGRRALFGKKPHNKTMRAHGERMFSGRGQGALRWVWAGPPGGCTVSGRSGQLRHLRH